YMAADALSAAAERAGVDLAVETQGSSGSTTLDTDAIAHADAVIFATDVGVKSRGRFDGKPLVESGVKRAINEPDTMVAEALTAGDDPHAARVAHDDADAADGQEHAGAGVGRGRRIQQVLMTGVSYMIPFVAAGGLLMALGFLVGGFDVAFVAQDVATGYSLSSLPGAQEYDGATGTLQTDRAGLALYLGAVLFTLGDQIGR